MNDKELLKNQIITELYHTGRINDLYFGRLSKSTENPLKKYIETKLYKNFMGVKGNEYVDDCYQELFVQLQKIPTDKFISLYNESDSRLMSYILRIIVLKLFAVDKRSGNPKHSFAKHLNFASVFNKNNYMVNPIEKIDMGNTFGSFNDSNDINSNTKQENVLILFDDEYSDQFKNDYGFDLEEVYSNMSSEQRFVFEIILKNNKRGRISAADQLKKQQLFQEIRDIKLFITQKNNEIERGLNVR